MAVPYCYSRHRRKSRSGGGSVAQGTRDFRYTRLPVAFVVGQSEATEVACTGPKPTLELNFWRRPGAWLGLEVSVLTLVPGKGRHHVRREEGQVRVVLLHRLVVSAARLQNPVFRTFELKLQLLEILVRLQVRIVFDYHEQSSQRPGKLIVGVDFLLRRFRAQERGTSVRNISEHRGFLLRITLDRLHQVRNQIRPALQIGIDLAPLSRDGFFFHRQFVARAHELAASQHKSEDHNNRYDNSGLHGVILLYPGRLYPGQLYPGCLYPGHPRRQSPCRSPSYMRPATPRVRSPSA